MSKVNSFKELKVWQKGMDLVEEVYRLSTHFPKEEQFGLTNQIRRAVVSVPSNIAEGFNRRGSKEFIHFLQVSFFGSLAEVETQLMLACRLNYISDSDDQNAFKLIEELSRMLSKLIISLRKKLKLSDTI